MRTGGALYAGFMRRNAGFGSDWLVAAALVLADRASKYIAGLLAEPVRVWEFSFGKVLNKEGLLGLAVPNDSLIYAGILVCAGLALVLFRGAMRNQAAHLGVWLLLAGAGSNLFDRMAYGGVVDVIGVADVTHFNIADVTILLGALALIESTWRRGRA
jgi:lipoprotein signal peptidase